MEISQLKRREKMINYNLIVYLGVGLIALLFILFIRNEMKKRKKDIELFKQQQLKESFDRNKISSGYIKK